MLAVAVQMLPTGFRRVSDGGTSKGPDLRAPLSVSDGFPTGFRQVSDGFPTGFRRVSDGRLVSDGLQTGFPTGSRPGSLRAFDGFAIGFWLSTGF